MGFSEDFTNIISSLFSSEEEEKEKNRELASKKVVTHKQPKKVVTHKQPKKVVTHKQPKEAKVDSTDLLSALGKVNIDPELIEEEKDKVGFMKDAALSYKNDPSRTDQEYDEASEKLDTLKAYGRQLDDSKNVPSLRVGNKWNPEEIKKIEAKESASGSFKNIMAKIFSKENEPLIDAAIAVLPSIGGGNLATYGAGGDFLAQRRKEREAEDKAKRKLAGKTGTMQAGYSKERGEDVYAQHVSGIGYIDQHGKQVKDFSPKPSSKWKYVTSNKTGITTVIDNRTGKIDHVISAQGLPQFVLKNGKKWEAAPYQMEELEKLTNRYGKTPNFRQSVEAYTQAINGLKALKVGGKIGDISGMVNTIRASGDKKIANEDKADYKSRGSAIKELSAWFQRQDKDRGLDNESYLEVKDLLLKYAKTAKQYIHSGIEGNLQAADSFGIPRELSARRLGMSTDMLPKIPKGIKYNMPKKGGKGFPKVIKVRLKSGIKRVKVKNQDQYNQLKSKIVK